MYIPLLLFIQHWFNFITSAIIKSHNWIQVNILYKQTCSQGLHQRNLMIFGTFRNDIRTVVSAIFFILHWPQCIYLVNIPEPVQHKVYALALPFDLRCESGTLFFYITRKFCILKELGVVYYKYQTKPSSKIICGFLAALFRHNKDKFKCVSTEQSTKVPIKCSIFFLNAAWFYWVQILLM